MDGFARVCVAQEGQGRPFGSSAGYRSACQPSADSDWVKYPVPVEQSHADHRDAEVAGGLEVVAGEDAEAAGILWQDGRDAILG